MAVIYGKVATVALRTAVAGLAFACLMNSSAFADHVDPSGWSLAPSEQPLLDVNRNAQKRYTVTFNRYVTPDVVLTDANGKEQKLAALLDSGKPTLLQFIFTSCSTICPVLTATITGAQGDISAASANYRVVAISIDPEYDTPAQLRTYAAHLKANSHWTFLTGSKVNIDKVLRAFDASYRGDNKMYHRPYTYLRVNQDQPWERIDGLISSASLASEYQAAMKLAAKH